jgi:hypothetical protein
MQMRGQPPVGFRGGEVLHPIPGATAQVLPQNDRQF